MNSSGMWENPAKWYQICSTMTLTRHELDVLHKFNWHPCLLAHKISSLHTKTFDTRQNCSTQHYLYLRILIQEIRVKLNVEIAVILDECNPNHLWNWMNAWLIFNHNLQLLDFEILFFIMPNHFLHLNYLLDETVVKLLVTYGTSVLVYGCLIPTWSPYIDLRSTSCKTFPMGYIDVMNLRHSYNNINNVCIDLFNICVD